MRQDLRPLRHGKERLYGTLVMGIGALIWLGVAAFVVAAALNGGSVMHIVVSAIYLALFGLFGFIARLFYRAHLFGHAVLLGERQFPHLHESLKVGAERLGLSEVPQAFLYNSGGLMNAFATRIAGTQMVLLTSALVDVHDPAQVDFVIGHELGHHAAGHLSFWKNLLKLPGTFVPLLGTAYYRSRELTADRMGAYCVGDVEAARGGLYMLACGSAKLNAHMNADAFSAQEDMVPPITGFLLHVFSGYPRLTRRVNEIESYFGGRGRVEPMTAVAPFPGAGHDPVPSRF